MTSGTKISLNSIELFAGGGGLALGVSKAGFAHSQLIELDSDSTKTLLANSKVFIKKNEHFSVIHKDIHDIDFSHYDEKIDLLSGGPPCQPFSIAGKSMAYNDKRDLFPEAARAISEIKPKAFIFENVKGLLRKSFSKYFGYIILQLTYPQIKKNENDTWENHLEILEKHHTSTSNNIGLKYNVVFRLVNAADYGVPQKRERVFIVGFRNDISGEWSFPKPTHSKESLYYSKYVTGEYWEKHNIKSSKPKENNFLNFNFEHSKKPWVTVRDALCDLPNPEIPNAIPNHTYQAGAKIYAGHTGSLLDEPSKTIKAGAHGVPGGENMIVMDNGTVRYYTIREAARLQTFPDDYLFPCSWTESMRQIGNAVPVQLGKIVSQSVIKTLKEYKVTNGRENIQSA